MRTLLALALIASATSLFATDGNTATATAQAGVTIYAPLKLASTGSLQFGKVVITSLDEAASVTLGANAAATYVNASAFTGNAKIATSVPTFSGSKQAGLPVAITASATMTDCTIDLATPTAIADDAATFSFPVHGKLNIPAGVTGAKTGTVSVTVNYI